MISAKDKRDRKEFIYMLEYELGHRVTRDLIVKVADEMIYQACLYRKLIDQMTIVNKTEYLELIDTCETTKQVIRDLFSQLSDRFMTFYDSSDSMYHTIVLHLSRRSVNVPGS